jgi:hypothetical protein
MKTGKEIKKEKFKDYTTIFGSVNDKEGKVLYINITSWVEPILDEKIRYYRVIRDINKKVNQEIYNLISSKYNDNFDKDRLIIDLDIKESGVKFGKKSFMNCEITLFSYMFLSVTSELMNTILDDISEHIITNVFKTNKYFYFHKKKK